MNLDLCWGLSRMSSMDDINPLDFFTDEQLLLELERRQEAKELAYLCYLALEDEERWYCMSSINHDGLQEVYQMEMEQFEDNPLYDSDNWSPDKDLEDQFEEDFEDED